MKIILLNLVFVLVVQVNTCHNKNKKKSNNVFSGTDFGTCYDDRETTENIESLKGKIIKITEEMWAIQLVDNETQRYAICKIPDELKKENLNVIVSGEVKKIAPNERWVAKPFKINGLKVVEEQ